MRFYPLFALLALALLAASCSKDNKASKMLDGSWQLDSWAYAGNDTIAAATLTDDMGSWKFAKCKSSETNCYGEQEGFLGGGQLEAFSWFFSNKGANFDMGGGTLAPAGASMAQVSGQWTVETQSENLFVISSTTCGSCGALGKSTLTFSRID